MKGPGRTEHPSQLSVGTRFTTDSVVIDDLKARDLVDLCGYTHSMFAGEGPPELIPGQLVLAVAAGLVESSGRIGDDVIALVGMEDVRFEGLLAPGDPMTVEVEVTGERKTSRAERRILEIRFRAHSGSRTIATSRNLFLFARSNELPG